MNFCGADTDFSSKAEAEAIGKTGRTVGEYISRIDLQKEGPDRLLILTDNGISVVGSVGLNMVDCLFKTIHHPDVQLQGKVFHAPIPFLVGNAGDQRLGAFIPMHYHVPLLKTLDKHG
ncbi:hypothetical protein SDC9_87126 [bioreactor metagenome]|uniref:Uncharacterized protein n=1 Tax=bioreactor metagenome TaxID=1076179 RepID=A0A644ZHV6_9ZZZZ